MVLSPGHPAPDQLPLRPDKDRPIHRCDESGVPDNRRVRVGEWLGRIFDGATNGRHFP